MELILLTNDDGIEAEGLAQLEESLHSVGEIVVVAPSRERSAVSHGLTIHTPIEVLEVSPKHYTLDGTPADCIIHALRTVVVQPPALVISGINHGANLGDDIMYSGTVAAAREASRHGIPALAVSQAIDESPISFKAAARFTRELAKLLLRQNMEEHICLNVNIPVRKIRGVKITRQGCAPHFPHFNSLDHRRYPGAMAEPREVRGRSEIPLDFEAIFYNYVSITPLQRDQTDYQTVKSLLQVADQLFAESSGHGE